uniref:Uncharacterized protein n=1 Tax=Setaria digitata TaxID=48799 RepID=A0A915PWA0_9BILA
MIHLKKKQKKIFKGKDLPSNAQKRIFEGKMTIQKRKGFSFEKRKAIRSRENGLESQREGRGFLMDYYRDGWKRRSCADESEKCLQILDMKEKGTQMEKGFVF